MRKIEPRIITEGRVRIPGSKSYTHRHMMAAGLADGVTLLDNVLFSEDTQLTLQALTQIGVGCNPVGNNRIEIRGCNGCFHAPQESLYLGNSGTSIRLLTALTVLGKGTYRLTGNKRMQQRPIRELLEALGQLGVQARSTEGNGCPPVEITAGPTKKSRVEIDCRKSSQYLSGLLLMAPCTMNGLTVTVTHGPVSKPYVDMTLEVMQQFGIQFTRTGYRCFHVPGRQAYRPGHYRIEGDCSQAGYFWAAAAVTGGMIEVSGINPHTHQGDIRFVELLAEMGCTVHKRFEGIRVTGNRLRAIDTDMSDLPDMVPTLAVVTAFADGTSVIRGVGQLKDKESNRIEAVVNELNKMGIRAGASKDTLFIEGGKPRGTIIDTYEDHRIAMSFAVAGLGTPNIHIRGDACVKKSFPDFWEVFEGLR